MVKKIVLFFVMYMVLSNIILSEYRLNASSVSDINGIGISGSFYNHLFRMVPGESYESSEVDIVIFNHYPNDIVVKLVPDLPYGVRYLLDSEKITIKSGENVILPVGLALSDNVVPGNYDIGISAEIASEDESNFYVGSSAQLRTKLIVFGEASDVKIETFLVDGKRFTGDISLSIKDKNNKLSPVGFSNQGLLEEKVIPGKYIAQVFWKGKVLEVESFDIQKGEKKEIALTIETIKVVEFSVKSLDTENLNRHSATKITYSYQNLVSEIKDAKMILKVYYAKDKKIFDDLEQGKGEYKDLLFQESELFSVPALGVEPQRGGEMSFIPKKGWNNGLYRYQLEIYGKDSEGENIIKLASSEMIELNIYKNNMLVVVSVVLILLILTAVIVVWYRKKQGPRHYGNEKGQSFE